MTLLKHMAAMAFMGSDVDINNLTIGPVMSPTKLDNYCYYFIIRKMVRGYEKENRCQWYNMIRKVNKTCRCLPKLQVENRKRRGDSVSPAQQRHPIWVAEKFMGSHAFQLSPCDVVATDHDESVMTHNQLRISNRNNPQFRALAI